MSRDEGGRFIIAGLRAELSPRTLCNIPPPVCILLTVVGVKDAPLLVEAHPGYHVVGFDRDVIRLPEIVLDDFATNPDPKRLLRPALDVLWQHAGLDSCPYFLPDGTWNLRVL
jgi:hypothetical protein